MILLLKTLDYLQINEKKYTAELIINNLWTTIL